MPRATLSLLAVAALAGCAGLAGAPSGGGAARPQEQFAAAKVAGTVTYLQRVALPPTVTIKVQLVDVSRMDAPAVVLGEQLFAAGGRHVPFVFEIAYDPTKIIANHSYAVQARIEDDGKLRFISDQRYAGITCGAPTHVEMVLKAVGS